MFSLQQLSGKGDEFCQLLEAAAQEAHESVRLVIELIRHPRDQQALDDLVLARRKEKKIAEQISEELVKTFVIPLSTTHVMSASIMGAGATRRLNAVKWGVVERMAWAWVLTLPITALLSYFLLQGLSLAGFTH